MLKFLSKIKGNPSITYGITVNNEAKEIEKLLSALISLIGIKDEILVLQDVTNRSSDVEMVLKKYHHKITIMQSKLNGDFASFKNNLIQKATKKYLFQIDADEIPKKYLIRNIKRYLIENDECDIFMVPRVNIVKGITQTDIDKWNWKKDENGYINFPDYQHRILKLNGKIFWKNKVHEELTGFCRQSFLPPQYKFCLVHIKDITKQKQQNELYESL